MNSKRMASVLRVRQIQERAARGVLANARRREREATDLERTTWSELDERSEAPVRIAARPMALAVAERAAIESGVLAAHSQRLLVQQAAAAVRAAMGEWSIAARRVEGLERLAERSRLAEAEEAARLASNEIDDLVLVRFNEQEAP